jgi:ParB-like chromosome segregation protein Spo0J
MNQYIYPKSIDISHIDFADFSYSISPDRKIILDETFTQSIIKHGILHPPIVKEIEPDSYVIVTGRKRLLAFRTVFPEEISCTCMIIPAKMQETDIFSVLLEDILTNRQLTPIEKAFFLQKISSLIDEKRIAEDFLPRINLPPDPLYYRLTVKLLNLEEPIIHEIHQGNINEKVALEIISLSVEDRLAVFHIISLLQLSVGYQKKLLNICRELASRMDKTITAILEDMDVQDILNHQEANPPQKAKNLMNWLSRKYLPRSSQSEDEFKRFIASMQLPRNVSVNHSPFFENDSVTLSITFSNKKSIQNAWKTIKDTIRNSDN